MHILADQLKPQQWHWCHGCGQRGNLVELAAAALNLSLPATIRLLAAEGILPDDTTQLARWAESHVPRLRLEQFREAAAASWLRGDHAWAVRVLARHRLLEDVVNSQEAFSLSPLVGTAACSDAELAFAPKSVTASAPGGKLRSTSRRRIFRGNGWEQVVALPLHDLPGRLSGFIFLGREGDLERDLVSRTSDRVGGPGVLVHPLNQSPGELPLVAVPNPWLLLRLQARHMRLAANPLPLAAWLPDRQLRQYWSYTRSVVFWWPQITVDILQQAMACGGQISCTGPQDTSLDAWHNYLDRFRTPQELYELVVHRAQPWPEAINQLARQPDNRFETLLLELSAVQSELATVISQLNQAAQRRARRVLHATRNTRAITLTRGTRQFVIRETPQGYFLVGSRGQPALLANGRLHLHELQHDSQTGQVTFHGELLLGDACLSVDGPLTSLQRGGFAWAQSQLLAAGVGLLTYDPAWNDQLLALASQFHPPQVRHVTSRIGYDTQTGLLRLPTGELSSLGWRPGAITHATRVWPAGMLTLPSTFNAEDAQRLSPESSAGLWECLLAVAQLLDESFAGRSRRVAFSSRGGLFDSVQWPVLEVLGCLAVTSRANNDVALRRLAKAAGEHGWPIAALGRFPATRWAETTTSGVICHQEPWNALCRRLEGGWHVIRTTANEPATAPDLASCGAILAAWLELRASQGFRPLAGGVADSFRDLLAAKGGRPEGLEVAQAVCYWDTGLPGDPGALPELIKLLVRGGLVEILPEGYTSRKVVILRRRVGSQEYLGLPFRRLERLLLRQRAAWNRKKVLRTLARHGVPARRKDKRWYVPLAWWQQHWLRVHSA